MELQNSFIELNNSLMELHNSFMDLHNSIMELHNSITELHGSTCLLSSIIDYEAAWFDLWISIIRFMNLHNLING